MNKDLLTKTREIIQATPAAKIDMSDPQKCIGAFVVQAAGETTPRDIGICHRAAELLGVSWAESDRLFVPALWPKGLYRALVEAEKAGDREEAKRVVLERIEREIGGGGGDYD